MTLKSQRSIAVLIVVILGICLFGSGIVAAQSNSPAPTPAPGGENLPSQAPGEDSVLPLGKTDKDDRRLIANGKSLTGKISPSTDEDTYIFYATEGQQVTINMTAKTTALDGYLKLYTARDEQLRAYDDDSGGNRNPMLYMYTIPRSGKYLIVLSSYGGYSSGTYTVRLDVYGGDSDDNRVLESGKTASGKIIPAYDIDSYFFQGVEGTRATIRMDKKGGSLDSYLYLYDPDNVLIAANDDSGGNGNALIDWVTLPTSGAYRVEARSYAGNSSGAYKIRLDQTKPNLALNKPSTAWNWHAPYYLPEYGNDGNLNTRWSGDYGTNWYWIDLGSSMTFNQVKINWEAAYATSYFIGWSDAPNCIGTYTGNNYTANSIGYKDHNLGKRTARCVAIRMDTALSWATNYSFWEFEVYNLAASNSASPPGSIPGDAVLVDVVPEADFSEEELIQMDLLSPTN
ncbi:MAG TPA: pre-peptidase C-terminal domain-containing protein [Promineifilum sp.]|nr:pre-peptidase C-terminal domain-containing protein [Promineifilum sp.]HRO91021.1 pre-peptidase C-terminal domain-containing protein [Promineifilum sp.]HRQ14099.1 pre-peptidase C-terminal domain-containing protein [Promineifilum sp.]HRQ14227.1 pre-peptidase C-terminal domain-containing protein [Promineifilum sp.]